MGEYIAFTAIISCASGAATGLLVTALNNHSAALLYGPAVAIIVAAVLFILGVMVAYSQ